MNVSLKWLKQYIDIDLAPARVSEVLTSIGLEVEGEEVVEAVKGGLEGVVIGHVVTCEKHPDADKLSLTTVDIGTGEALSIVCGAPNVAAGQKVLVATIGATLYTPAGEAWTIKKGKIRGAVSEGMICAEDELGLGTSHAGIMVLPPDAAVGTLAKDYFRLENDYVYEVGLTPNRSDATNHLGVARDLAAALTINHGYTGGVRLPDVSHFQVESKALPIAVSVEDTAACPRYTAVSIQGVTVGESPDWLKQRLAAIGVRSINNVVDITNFILHELGQPLHAFDLDRIQGGQVQVKTLPEGTIFKALDGTERTLSAEDLIICDGNGTGMCIGGVFGGIDSGVTDSTVNIFLESAHFNAKSIRRSSMRHQLRTDAAKVFEKGSDPNITLYALQRAALLIAELAGGRIASEVIDIYPVPVPPAQVLVRYSYINRLIGTDIPRETVLAILAALDMAVLAEEAGAVTVAVPTNKSDVTREADVVEEILRIYGFNNVPVPDQVRSAIQLAPSPDPSEIRNRIGDFLAASGFYEMMAVSLSESRYYRDLLPLPDAQLVYINNTSNVHLDIMRPSMLFSGLEAVLHNQNRQQSNLRLFEFGKTYRHGEGGIDEQWHLTLLMTGQRYAESWLNADKAQVTYYTLKTQVSNLLARLGFSDYQATAIQDEVFGFGLRYHRGAQVLVEFGKANTKAVRGMGIRGDVFYADFRWEALLKALRKHRVTTTEIGKYPSTRRDLALIVDNSVKFGDIAALAEKSAKKLLKDVNLFDVYVNDKQLGEGKKSCAVSFVFEDSTKTLQDKDVDKVMKQLISTYEQQLGAYIRS